MNGTSRPCVTIFFVTRACRWGRYNPDRDAMGALGECCPLTVPSGSSRSYSFLLIQVPIYYHAGGIRYDECSGQTSGDDAAMEPSEYPHLHVTARDLIAVQTQQVHHNSTTGEIFSPDFSKG